MSSARETVQNGGPAGAALEGLRIHLVHYTPLVDRRRHVERELESHGLNQFPVHWITEFDREEILQEHANGKFGDPAAFPASFVSVILKHLEAFRCAAQSDAPWHLVLEDDILIQPDFLNRLSRALTQLPDDWEIFFVGDGCDLHIPFWRRRPGRLVYFRGYKPTWWGGGGISRCGAAYLIRPESARRFLTSKHAAPPYHTAIDWLMNAAGLELKFRSYWAEPPLICQGAFPSWTLDKKLNPGAG